MTAAPQSYGVPFVSGFIGGIVACVAAFGGTIVYLDSLEPSGWADNAVDGVSSLSIHGFVFYEAQFVDIETTLFGQTGFGGSVFSVLPESADTFLLHLIPVAALGIVSFVIGWAYYSNFKKTTDGALVGIALPIGYGFAAIGLRYIVEIDQTFGSIAPSLVDTVIMMGLVFPVFIGAIGGLLGFWIHKQVAKIRR